MRVAVDNPDTRHALAEWCAATEARRTGSSVQNPACWLPQVTARTAARTDPARELRGQHGLALSALEEMAAVDVDESAARGCCSAGVCVLLTPRLSSASRSRTPATTPSGQRWRWQLGLAAAVIATLGLCVTVSFAFTEPDPVLMRITAVVTVVALLVEILTLRSLAHPR